MSDPHHLSVTILLGPLVVTLLLILSHLLLILVALHPHVLLTQDPQHAVSPAVVTHLVELRRGPHHVVRLHTDQGPRVVHSSSQLTAGGPVPGAHLHDHIGWGDQSPDHLMGLSLHSAVGLDKVLCEVVTLAVGFHHSHSFKAWINRTLEKAAVSLRIVYWLGKSTHVCAPGS